VTFIEEKESEGVSNFMESYNNLTNTGFLNIVIKKERGERMLNRVILIGRIATEPVRRYTPTGVAVASFRLAVSRPTQTPNGKDADFFTIVAWRELAEKVASAMKGRLVCIEGKLRERSWTAADGTRRREVEIVADTFRFLDKPPQVIPPEEYPPEEEIGIEDIGENLHVVKEDSLDEDIG
jgi:single-strand DNA-binding protein